MKFSKLPIFLSKGDKSIFHFPVSTQQEWLTEIGDAKDLIDRSYKQYLCQCKYISLNKRILLNIISGILSPIYIILLFIYTLFVKKSFIKIDAICENHSMRDALPEELKLEYDIDFDLWNSGAYITLNDLKFIAKIAKQVQAPYMLLKCIIKISRYSYMIKSCEPRAIIVSGEYSFTSSVLTEYCRWHNVKHINFMHGEKLFFIRDSYFAFDLCYVWSQHYVDLFTMLNAQKDQFRIARPKSLRINTSQFLNSNYFADYKYYLAYNSEEEIVKISEVLHQIKDRGYTFKVRPHPRYSDNLVLNKYFNKYEIEDVNKVSISESISNVTYVIGLYTTVLSQAFFAGQKVVLDDITYSSKYEVLKDFYYILTNQEGTYKFSEIIYNI